MVRAVRNVDLKIFPGDFLTIFGPNGAGKTTLLRIIASLTHPTVGRIEFSEENADQKRVRVGYVSHQSLLYNELTGFENLLFYGNLYGLDKPFRQASDMLTKMGLEEAGQRLVREYSRGMKQRLTLGPCPVTRPFAAAAGRTLHRIGPTWEPSADPHPSECEGGRFDRSSDYT